ncbi:MAG: hypothetical protein U0804_20315 [Gemmataceae bacterium]
MTTTRPRPPRRAAVHAAILDAVGAAGHPLTAKEVLRELRLALCDFSHSTITKALADLTADGRLLNPLDKRGYRLPEVE